MQDRCTLTDACTTESFDWPSRLLLGFAIVVAQQRDPRRVGEEIESQQASQSQNRAYREMEESPRSGGMSSPEAKLGLRVEDLWDIQEPQLTPSEKLNSCFESISVTSFPSAPSLQVEIKSDSSLAEVIQELSKHKLLSAPVCNVEAPEDASWIDRYIGIVEFAGIVQWLLEQSEGASVDMTGGGFFENLISSNLYKNTKVKDISGSFRWAPFLALQKSDNFLTMLLLLSKYKMKSLPVVDLGEGKIDNVITQAAVVHMLAECVGLHWFENWGTKKLCQLGLPTMKPGQLIKVCGDEPVLGAFRLLRQKGIGGLPVVESSGKKPIGNISMRDVQFLLTVPEIYKNERSITAKEFLMAVRSYLEKHQGASPMLRGTISCRKDDTVKEVILKLDSEKIQRIYVVNEGGDLEGVITLRDIISKLVHEPRGYFGDFFDGVTPLPPNSRV
ncbi:hypothetical protein Syun_024485 [Stephania yunnanensis]|uniref:CBS domain-containing protein n=1 Tax=Stephania yunnanensis TaxID=152371 RepID=A0AAP0NIQ3_9MAGN